MNQKADPALMLFSLSYRGKLINGEPYSPPLMGIGSMRRKSPPLRVDSLKIVKLKEIRVVRRRVDFSKFIFFVKFLFVCLHSRSH